jgi:hypothetical protein
MSTRIIAPPKSLRRTGLHRVDQSCVTRGSILSADHLDVMTDSHVARLRIHISALRRAPAAARFLSSRHHAVNDCNSFKSAE